MPLPFQHFQRALPYQAFLEHFATPEQQQRWQRMYDAVTLTAEQRVLLQTFRRKMPVLCLSGPWCGDCVNACPIFQKIAEASPLIDLRFINRHQKFDATPPAASPIESDPDDIRARPLGKMLVNLGFLNPERVQKALLAQEEQRAKGMNVKIGDVMTELGLISATQRDLALAHQSGFTTLEDADRQAALELSICGAPRVPVLVFFSEDGHECARFGERTLVTYRQKAAAQLAKTAGAMCPTGLFAPPADQLAAVTAEWLTHFERVQWLLLTSPRLMKLHGEA